MIFPVKPKQPHVPTNHGSLYVTMYDTTQYAPKTDLGFLHKQQE